MQCKNKNNQPYNGQINIYIRKFKGHIAPMQDWDKGLFVLLYGTDLNIFWSGDSVPIVVYKRIDLL